MSAVTGGARPAPQLADRLLDALNNPARREWNVAGILLSYVALWTLYAAVAKGSQDIHADMSEQSRSRADWRWATPSIRR